MAVKTEIAWTDATWNVLVGCSRKSAGCVNCYAESEAYRLEHKLKQAKYAGTTKLIGDEPRWTGQILFWEPVLDQPIKWKKPRMIFVNSMSDLFHESVPDEWIDRIFAVMALAPHHIFQILTKRPERMRQWATCDGIGRVGYVDGWAKRMVRERHHAVPDQMLGRFPQWPLPHVWLGVSVEDQATANERIPVLLKTPAAVRWVSYEPALGPVDFGPWLRPEFTDTGEKAPWGQSLEETRMLNWIVVGGESGLEARPFDLFWARAAILQCKSAGVSVFMKQIGSRPWWDGIGAPPPDHIYRAPGVELNGRIGWQLEGMLHRKGGGMEDWPRDLRVREYPR